MSLKSLNQKLEDKTDSQNKFGHIKMNEGAVMTETDLQFTIISLRFVNVKKNFRKFIF